MQLEKKPFALVKGFLFLVATFLIMYRITHLFMKIVPIRFHMLKNGSMVSHKSHHLTIFLALMTMLITNMALGQITIQKFASEISCDIEALAELPPIQAESKFGGLQVHLEEEIFSGGCLGTLVRTFHFVDQAGEKASAVQIVHLTDILPPDLIGIPNDITVKADQIPQVFPVDARDNSGAFCEVLFQEVREGNILLRTWSTVDGCGNNNQRTQKITLR